MLLRSLAGLQNAWLISVGAVLLMSLVGAAIGLVAGYYGGGVDTVPMRLTDAQSAVEQPRRMAHTLLFARDVPGTLASTRGSSASAYPTRRAA